MQEEEFCLEALKKTQEEEYPVFKPAILSGFQIAARTVFLPSARRALDLGILQLLGENPTGNIHRGFHTSEVISS